MSHAGDDTLTYRQFRKWRNNALIGFVILFAAAFMLTRPKAFDPLAFPRQTVTSKTHGHAGAVLGSTVNVTGVTCVSGSKSVRLSGELVWTSVRPPGALVAGFKGISVQKPGCTKTAFENPIPPKVDALTRQLAGSRGYVVWIIGGRVTPEGGYGVTRLWATNSFRLYVR